MARRPLTRVDGEHPQGLAQPAPEPALPATARVRPTRAPAAAESGRLPRLAGRAAPQVWLGAGCVLILVSLLAAGAGRDETGRSPLDRAPADANGPIVATLQVPGADLRPVRRICDDEGLPAELCARSAACAPAPPPTPGRTPRVIRLFLRAPAGGGCA